MSKTGGEEPADILIARLLEGLDQEWKLHGAHATEEACQSGELILVERRPSQHAGGRAACVDGDRRQDLARSKLEERRIQHPRRSGGRVQGLNPQFGWGFLAAGHGQQRLVQNRITSIRPGHAAGGLQGGRESVTTAECHRDGRRPALRRLLHQSLRHGRQG